MSQLRAIDRLLRDRYVLPEVAERMGQHLSRRAAEGAYDAISDPARFASTLTSDLQEISRDRHLRVRFSERPLDRSRNAGEPPESEREAFRDVQRRENAGFTKAEILPGNVGYLSLRYFGISDVAGPAIAGALQFLAGTDAFILDLRDNGGAIDPGSIAILCSYFMPPGRTHLNSLHWREGDRVEQSWSLPLLPGPRYLDKPLFVLTSRRTFSGAEECAYNLQTRKRATLVGETTGGGANPGWEIPATDHFAVWVPQGRAVNPVTGDNWEGRGVRPEIEVPAGRALLTAHGMALEQLVPKYGADPGWQNLLNREREKLQARLKIQPVNTPFRLAGHTQASRVSLVGPFNGWTPGVHELQRTQDGWTLELPLDPGSHPYKFWVDGEWLLDPANPDTEADGPHTNSIRIVPAKS